MTGEEIIELVKRHPGLEIWHLHDYARSECQWKGTSVALADRMHVLKRQGKLRWEKIDSLALWYVA